MSSPAAGPLAALLSAAIPEVARLGPGTDAGGLRRAAEALGWSCAMLEGARMKDKAGMMDELSRGLRLPDYFGRNWDALQDCLSEDSVLAGRGGLLIVLRGADETAEAAPEDFRILVEVLGEASRRWRARTPPIPFKTALL